MCTTELAWCTRREQASFKFILYTLSQYTSSPSGPCGWGRGGSRRRVWPLVQRAMGSEVWRTVLVLRNVWVSVYHAFACIRMRSHAFARLQGLGSFVLLFTVGTQDHRTLAQAAMAAARWLGLSSPGSSMRSGPMLKICSDLSAL